MRIKIKIGDKFNRLTVNNELDTLVGNGRNIRQILCKCECGNFVVIPPHKLISGHTSSCGCLKIEKCGNINKTHGMRKTRIYKIWQGIKTRCNNKACKAYKDYGGRGIGYSTRWGSFDLFYIDMSNGYKDDLTIERIDNNLGYFKENCRWASRDEQSINKRTSINIEYDGEQKNLSILCKEKGLEYRLVWERIFKLGWNYKKALGDVTE